MSADVRLEMRREFWRELMASPELEAALLIEAEHVAAEAEARVGAPPRPKDLRNPNFVAMTATRYGKTSPYPVGLVIAANPRSIWKARHEGALRG